MGKKEAPISALQQYLPPGTYEPVLQYLQQYKVHLTVARARRSILGDYRHRIGQQNHRISINGNLNPYAFLITLLHELAHLLTYEQYGNRAAAHGREWKMVFGQLLAQFLEHKVFPDAVAGALMQSISNPAASSCADAPLLRILRTYDGNAVTTKLVEELPMQSCFKTNDGRVFRKGQKLRTRFQCTEITTGKLYLFSPVYEVELIMNH